MKQLSFAAKVAGNRTDALALDFVTAAYLADGFHADHSRLLQPKRPDDGTTGVVKFGRCLPRFPGQFCTLMERLRALALAGTELARASAATIRVKLIKIGAAILRNTRRVTILLASHHPMRRTFLIAARALAP